MTRFPLRLCSLGAALALLLSACAPEADTVPAATLGQAKTVGIISAIGDKFSSITTTFENQPAERYGIDAYAIGLVKDRLAGRYSVQPVKYDVVEFGPDRAELPDTGLFTPGDPLGAVIRAHASPSDLDLYIVLMKGMTKVENGNRALHGLGLIRGGDLFTTKYWVHATYSVIVVDGHTGEVLANNSAIDNAHPFDLLDPPDLPGPFVAVDASFWPEDIEHVPADKMERLAETLKPLLARTLPDTMRAMKLAP
ncbi:hypothetical protein [Dongia sedimenti]|uniref:5'-Nucleotidase C-terminal domain-containing protein n=1 Tax=Dongia sedimenti TaxID=3064282 RepID=A0ABU0YLZ4_9PROT|nr:hypothetical protein [Rhodospirillaceae bacterium R-7]